jgi:glycosyltransferase involved in cell wall biosynthesis
MLQRRRIVFVSECGASWGGSEELWSRTALDLVAQGFPVSASVAKWSPPHSRMLDLMERGVELWFRPDSYPLWRQAWRKLTAPHKSMMTLEVQRLFTARPADLVVLSDGGPFPAIDFLELCVSRRLPFVTIGQANSELSWVDDADAERYRIALASALRCYFVSKANLRLAEKQIGCELSNAEVVWNPVNVDLDATPPWPQMGPDGELRLACVARLDPTSKGQDILFEVLAGPAWAARRWRLHVYGEGPMRNGLKWLAQRLGLSDRIVFPGHASVAEIWASNHVLVMPSRYEGMPLAVVEAMLCGRPVVATDVAGHSEIIEDGVTGFLADAPTVSSMAKALDRFWARRADAVEIGAAASKRIRGLRPPDPVRIFSEKIKKHMGLTGGLAGDKEFIGMGKTNLQTLGGRADMAGCKAGGHRDPCDARN